MSRAAVDVAAATELVTLAVYCSPLSLAANTGVVKEAVLAPGIATPFSNH
ncbi:MAG TPA: hypothetical protein VI320_24720 [Terracidiphilus sp.]